MAEANINVSVDPTSGSVEDTFVVEVIVSGQDAQQVKEPKFEDSDSFTLSSTNKFQEIAIINGAATWKLKYSYEFSPNPNLTPGAYKLPQGTVELANGTEKKLKDLTVNVTQKESGQTGSPDLDFAQITDNLSPYVGQQVIYSGEIVGPVRMQASLSDLSYTDFWHESFGEAQESVRSIGDSNKRVITIKDALFPNKSGEITIPARKLTAQVQVLAQNTRRNMSRNIFPNFFDMNDYRVVTKNIVANPITLKVKPLPPAPLSQAYIPVGNISARYYLDKTTVKEGDTITFKIEVSGDGNLRPLELPDPAKFSGQDFRVYYDKPEIQTEIKDNHVFFKKLFSIAVVPLKAGELQIPEIQLLTFNPDSQQYKTLRAGGKKISVIVDPSAKKIATSVSPAATDRLEEEKKKDVAVLAEDLFPQRIGAPTFASSKQIPHSLVFFILVLFPSVAMLFRLYYQRLVLLAQNPSKLLQMKALTTALSRLDELQSQQDLNIEELSLVIRRYVSHKCIVHADCYTAKEVESYLLTKIKNKSVVAQACEFLAKLERYRYGGTSSFSNGDFKNMIAEGRKLINSLDKSF